VSESTRNASGASSFAWRLTLHSQRLVPGSEIAFDHGTSVVFLNDGKVIVQKDGEEAVAHQNREAWVQRSPSRLVDGGAAASIHWWTLSPADEHFAENGKVLLAQEIRVNAATCLLRCDQVEFPPGGIAYLHTHAGPGIRRLRSGTLQVHTNGESHEYVPGDAWFEPGPVPVYAEASPESGAAFLRVMVLPVAFKGKSSITYVREEDRVKPKDQRYCIFLDEETIL
jgi:quercetin dioxygenase-like cupin family protein